MAEPTIAFIVNPKAGISNKRSLLRSLQKSASEHPGWAIFPTRYAGHATRLAKRAIKEGYQKVVAVGGDGTVNEVGRALLHTGIPMGIIPVGSGNGLARHLRIPLDMPHALKIIGGDQSIAIDAGIINGKYPFFCTAGVGFDAQVGKQFAQAGQRGIMTYLKTIFEEYFTYKPQHYKITVDGRVLERKAFLITMANASQWGNNAVIAPRADIMDGMLDITLMSPFHPLEAPAVGILLITRNIDASGHTESLKGKEIRIERDAPGLIHCDGDALELGSTLIIQTLHHALTVLA